MNWAINLINKLTSNDLYGHKWRLTQHFKEAILEGNVQDLKCKALSLELLSIDVEMKTVKLRIKIEDQNKKGLTYLDYEDGIAIGNTLTILDLNHSMEITIT